MYSDQQDDYQSLNKGVFVIPWNPDQAEAEAEAGPSRPGPSRPLKRVYEKTFQRYTEALENYENDKVSDQVDEVHAWLERCRASSEAPLLKFQFPIHRLPVALIQDTSPTLDRYLRDEIEQMCTLHARDLGDLASATKAVVVGFMGDSVGAIKKSGRAPIEEVEEWWKVQKQRLPLLLHIEQTQLLSSNVLSELLYILSLHTELPIRVLLSVPSISTFTSSWIHVEPTAIDLSILHHRTQRKRQSLLTPLAAESISGPLKLSADWLEDMKIEHRLLGSTAFSILKSLKWELLHHEINSPLAELPPAAAQAILLARKENPDVPGADLFEIEPTTDSVAALNPAPRTSILSALANSEAFTKQSQSSPGVKPIPNSTSKNSKIDGLAQSPRTPSKKRRRRIESPSAELDSDEPVQVSSKESLGHTAANTNIPLKDRKGDLKEMETMFNLWKSAGRNLNLWDWLEAFKVTVEDGLKTGSGDDPSSGFADQHASPNGEASNTKNGDVEIGSEENKGESGREVQPEMDEDTAARLHATFVRFCEEARMLGLVRARGKVGGRRGDEVAKGIGMV